MPRFSAYLNSLEPLSEIRTRRMRQYFSSIVMKVDCRSFLIQKLYPLAISRGTMSHSENLFVTVSDGQHTGLGELSPATGSAWTADRGMAQIYGFVEQGLNPIPFANDRAMREFEMDPPAMAALDVALWDLLGKQAGLPLHRLLGLPLPTVPTSVTIGINPPEVTRERVPDILRRTGAKCLKIKLGSPEGRDHDREHFLAAAEASAPFGVKLRVDANGGWTVSEAIEMMCWLAERGVEAGKAHGKKLHGLRKQFGSEVATTFGLFAAQKLLGHASPITTSQHYSAQTDLPALTHVRIVG